MPQLLTAPEAYTAARTYRQQVLVKLPGSQRDGKTAVVRSAIVTGDGQLEYELWLDDATLRRDLRKMMCCSGWLEVIASDAGEMSG